VSHVGIDVLDGAWDTGAWWSTTNFGEAIPGVLTPLNWSFWGAPGERAARRAFVAIGAMAAPEAAVPADPRARAFAIFHGRFACKVDFLGDLGDRLPGTSGAAVAEQILGELPAGFTSQNTLRRLPVIAAKLPVLFVTLPRRMTALSADTQTWWTGEIARSGSLDLDGARAQWRAASARFEDVMASHVACLFSGVQPIFDQVQGLAVAAGDPGLAARAMAGQGSHAELALVEDLWELSRERLTLAAFLARHGYHGPAEGELASRMWREDPGPITSVARQYAATPEAESPAAVGALRAGERRAAQAEILAGVPRVQRAKAKLVLRLADRYLPLRGVGKASFLQTVDVTRAASRRIGEHLVDAGTINDRDDVFYLLSEELLQVAPGTALKEVVAERRARRAEYLAVRLPAFWHGRPEVVDTAAPEEAGAAVIQGIGASPGVVEGRVRVVLDPDFDDVEAGEILVAPTTDPSWASIMFTAGALVVDLGGLLSHAAVVARELGIPCVMGTGRGTRALHTGDLCRVDGQAGTIEVLESAVAGGPPAEG
jgi:phosphohistidine swiveling domain-containing protein